MRKESDNGEVICEEPDDGEVIHEESDDSEVMRKESDDGEVMWGDAQLIYLSNWPNRPNNDHNLNVTFFTLLGVEI